MKHLEVKSLWVQDLVKRRNLRVTKVCGKTGNWADLGTKPLARERLESLRKSCGVVILSPDTDLVEQEEQPLMTVAAVNMSPGPETSALPFAIDKSNVHTALFACMAVLLSSNG